MQDFVKWAPYNHRNTWGREAWEQTEWLLVGEQVMQKDSWGQVEQRAARPEVLSSPVRPPGAYARSEAAVDAQTRAVERTCPVIHQGALGTVRLRASLIPPANCWCRDREQEGNPRGFTWLGFVSLPFCEPPFPLVKMEMSPILLSSGWGLSEMTQTRCWAHSRRFKSRSWSYHVNPWGFW